MDLIDRDKLIEAIGINRECECCQYVVGNYSCGCDIPHADICEVIAEVPTIDAVSVVRCKECMFSEVYQNDSSGVMGRFCEAFTQVRMVSDDDFCSYGEKETDHE